MIKALADLKARYEADLARLENMERGLKKQLEDTTSRIFGFRGAIEAVQAAHEATATPTPQMAPPALAAVSSVPAVAPETAPTLGDFDVSNQTPSN